MSDDQTIEKEIIHSLTILDDAALGDHEDSAKPAQSKEEAILEIEALLDTI